MTNVDTVWRSWMRGPETTRRARVYDLRELATFLRIPQRAGDDEQRARMAARELLKMPAPRARARLIAFADWSRARVAASSVARRLATVASWCGEASLHGLGHGVPRVRRPKRPRVKARECPPWVDVIATSRTLDGRDLAILWLLAGCGLRRSEVIGLRWSDVKLTAKPPRIVVHRKGGETVERTIGPKSAAALARMVWSKRSPDSRVFRGQRGDLTDNGLARIVTAWGLGTPHALRRAGASELRRRGASASQLQAWLGHVSLATTDAYARELDDQAGAATALLES